MTGAEKIKKIIETIESGHFVNFVSRKRIYSIGPLLLKRRGCDLFSANGNDILMQDGNKMRNMKNFAITYSKKMVTAKDFDFNGPGYLGI